MPGWRLSHALLVPFLLSFSASRQITLLFTFCACCLGLGLNLYVSMTPEQFVEAIGTGNVIHNSGDLFGDHLRSVQRVLKEWGEDEELQLAGLYHSIYGTEGFQDFQLSFDRRDDIKKLIGEVAGSKPR